MRILFCHPNFPAQFRRIAPALVAAGHEVVFVAKQREWHAPASEGIHLLTYTPHRGGGGAAIHPYLRRFDAAVLEGQAVYRAIQPLLNQGWQPDWIVNHVGYGNGLYLSDAFPEARKIGFFEWYYNPVGADVDFLRRAPVEPDRRLRLRTWNAQILIELAACDVCVSPTKWQAKQFPAHLQERFNVVHEGVDCAQLAQLRSSGIAKPTCLPDDADIEILTYVSRGFEDYRGFPQAMQAIEILLKQRPNLHVLIVGADSVAYGAQRSDGRSWGTWAKAELELDPARVHWLGILQEEQYHAVLACSTVHLYLTVPFVLSWSLLEAMAAGCAIVSSATAPVQEVLINEQSALLVDFFDSMAQAQAISTFLHDFSLRNRLSAAAQQGALAYDCSAGLAGWLDLLGVDTTTTVGSTGKNLLDSL